ncbi:FAD:protein FMN transferase [Hoeflea poritis]|uniref:FAD:protein FMN transferase n=1 Tax=Hoeflea poritis TaxID=2993659 RepID=A0ABT4VJT7_9HYPH|nr:FAD:protein FMN transferase [Hoeflea poritis]MDA4844410.1 FAD:protein FMN transferase [Hoeflea poritis]
MSTALTRRRFIALTAATISLSGNALAGVPVARWRGTALGAAARMTFVGMEPKRAAPIFAAVEAEIGRLERIFSLYRENSELSRLNAEGHLAVASMELVELLSLCDALNEMTAGAFDPTVQPLWQLYAERSASGKRPSDIEIDAALEKCGWRHVRRRDRELSFGRPGMAITLNGIAQGYVTDRIAALLRSFGLKDVAIDIGEVAALGRAPSGAPWNAGIAAPDGTILRETPLTDRALATSAPLATVLDREGRLGHILDPRTGRPGALWQLVSVSAQSAALADGLSTAFCLNARGAIDAVVAALPDVKLEYLA